MIKTVIEENSWLFSSLAEQQGEEELVTDREKEKAAMLWLHMTDENSYLCHSFIC